MAKSDSTRKPLPNVWLLMLPDGDFIGYVSKTKAQAKEMFEPGDRMAQYAPVQKPRRCVWVLSLGSTRATDVYETSCKQEGWPAADWTHCPYCGGKIVRRKS